MKRVAIVGGGVAGLAAAYELARQARNGASLQVVLFEASTRLGGIIETVHEGEFVIECGPDAWVTEKPWARELAEELGLGAEVMPSNDATRKTYVLVDKKLQAMPDGMRMMVPVDLDSLGASELFSAGAKLAYHEELGRAEELRAEAPDEDESVAEFVRRHFGQEVLTKIGAPLLSGVFGGDVTKLSVQAVMAPFVAMEREHGSLIAALQARDAGVKKHSVFTTLRSGMGTLVDRMIATIPEDWIRLAAEVRFVSYGDEGWLVGTARGVERFDAVMMAAPIDVACSLLEPVDAEMAPLMAMEASSAVVVAFGFPDAAKFPVPPGFGFLVPPGSDSLLLAATFVDQKFEDRVPQGGRLVRAFFGCKAAERLMRCGNDETAAVARMELARILGPLPEPQVTVVRRWPRSLPQYAVGHLERMKRLDARASVLDGLSLLGNGYRGVGVPDLIRDARVAARRIVGKSESLTGVAEL
ncbi:protoporphyrinogen oxidase [Tunturibacter empetritectus]|uniref:Coproporphyrinogen III oxidase n=1 Tax=Tunturiibacter empetritectus TaxID=3069691 RepID=A0A7W8IHE8_9BACT|nr:protoporphyrinogen oxidase [Edaphobacter lichenicola]MBB5317092.1 oxygen-dependent protoporphyrinogen oxidase [Edaphobacter lichenicola]